MGFLAQSQDIAIEGFGVLAIFKMLILPNIALCPRNCNYSPFSVVAVQIRVWHCGYGTKTNVPEQNLQQGLTS